MLYIPMFPYKLKVSNNFIDIGHRRSVFKRLNILQDMHLRPKLGHLKLVMASVNATGASLGLCLVHRWPKSIIYCTCLKSFWHSTCSNASCYASTINQRKISWFNIHHQARFNQNSKIIQIQTRKT